MVKEVLQGIRVLDISRYRAGPTCGQILADMGAEVIRIERPGGEDDGRLEPFATGGKSFYLMFTCRNKKDITLNLREPKGQRILKELVKRSDVVIENFGPDVNKRLGLDYESLKKVKENIIVTSVSGFGQYGPYASKLGFDGIAQAMSGLMWVTGFPQGLPVKSGVSFIDTTTGIYGALGTMFALYHRERTGEGQLVDVCLLDTAVSFMETYIAEYEITGEIHPQIGNCHSYAGPVDACKAKDGYFFIHIVGDAIWGRFLKTMGREELATDQRFETDYKRARPEIRQFFANWLNEWAADKTVAEVVEHFNQAGVPCGPVNTIPQVAADPHIRAREMIVEVEHPEVGNVPLIGIPFKLSKTPGAIKTTSPMLGEHNEEIYCGLLGYTTEELTQLTEKSII
ncbi:MAG: CoA transferase [Dehalococcoidales bacterium]|nr:CoA transferase [Dehalococcoidales bacterium]